MKLLSKEDAPRIISILLIGIVEPVVALLDGNRIVSSMVALPLYSALIYVLTTEALSDVFTQFNPLNKPYELFNIAALLGMVWIASLSIYTSSLLLLSFLSPTSQLFKYGAPLFCGVVSAIVMHGVYKTAMAMPTTHTILERK